MKEDRELALRDGAEVRYEPTFMDVIAAAAKDPTTDIQKMKELLAMKERLDAQAAQTAFNVSMKQAQSEMVPVVRRTLNEHTRARYATLEAIDEEIRPIYTKHGFSLSFNAPSTADGGVTVSCTALHEAGHSKEYQLTGALDGVGSGGKANKTLIQALGSTVSYLKRYLTCMIFNVTLKNEDKDGNALGKNAAVNQEQADNISSFITELGLDEHAVSNFLKIMEAKGITEIKADRYRQAMIILESKRRRNT